MSFCTIVKEVLCNKIQEMATHAWLFVKKPGVDFTRNRKLGFAATMHCLIAMESGSLQKELLSAFRYDLNAPTASAFVCCTHFL